MPETSGKSLEEMAQYFAEITDDPSMLIIDSISESSPLLTVTENAEKNTNACHMQ